MVGAFDVYNLVQYEVAKVADELCAFDVYNLVQYEVAKVADEL